jgi:hypothetical protein
LNTAFGSKNLWSLGGHCVAIFWFAAFELPSAREMVMVLDIGFIMQSVQGSLTQTEMVEVQYNS